MPDKQQTFTWTNDDIIYASLGHNELIKKQCDAFYIHK